MFGIFLISLIFVGGLNLSLCQNDPVVKTPIGLIRGINQTSHRGNLFYSFRGIPYAQNPVGNLRFKPPAPVLRYQGILNATEDGPACYQPRFPNVAEDCLRLNIYTHRINNPDGVKRPVLVYIHGGAFIYLSSQSPLYGPDYLMDHDIVLVTVNYRLGTLGFFSTGDNLAPGNYGMKDQVAALKWVRNNIKYFGGDSDRVTLAGESAGAVSVGLHLISPMSRGLFHGAMMLSGSATNFWATIKNPSELAKKQAKLLNCSSDRSEDIVNCLRELPAEDVTNVVDLMHMADKEKSELISLWNKQGPVNGPVVELENDEEERFLTKDPILSLQEGDFANVPIFIGTSRDEMIKPALAVLYNDKWAADLTENWTTISPAIFHYRRNDTISNRIREFYFGSSSRSFRKDSVNDLECLLSDSFIIYGVLQSAKHMADKNTKPVYLYQFNYVGEGIQSRPAVKWEDKVAHGDDLFYAFYVPFEYPVKFDNNSVDGQFMNKYTTLWKNFVETGNPTPEASEHLDNLIWKPYTNTNPAHLDLNENLTLRDGLYEEERFLFWNSIFPSNTLE